MLSKVISIVLTIIKTLFYKENEDLVVQWYDMNSNISLGERNEIPKIIWLYWDGKEIPKIVEICINSIKKHCSGYQINILSPETLQDYIDFPCIKADVEPANIADLIRLMLLEKYGGIWMDASILLTESIDWIIEKMSGQDAFLFYSDECTVDIKKPISENWLIVAPKKSAFIKAWTIEYRNCILSSNPKEYYKEVKGNKKLMQKINNPNYLLCYISALVTLNAKDYHILYASSGTTGHYFNYKYRWNSYAISTLLLLKNGKSLTKPKLVKITGSVRPVLSRMIKYKVFIRNSMLGHFF